jgi:signal transduction histidine kinase
MPTGRPGAPGGGRDGAGLSRAARLPEGGASPGPRRRRLSLRARLNLLVAACVLPLLGLVLIGDWLDYRRAHAEIGARALLLARSLADDVGRAVAGEIVLGNALALSGALGRHDLAAFRAQALAFLATQPAGTGLLLFDPGGQPLLALGAAVPAGELDRAARGTGRAVVGDVLSSAAAAGPEFAIALPIRDEAGAAWVVELEPGGRLLDEVLEAQHATRGTVVAVLDAHGAVLARAPSPPWHLGELAEPRVRAAMLAAPEGMVSAATLDGVPVLAGFARVPGLGWHAGVGVPRAEAEAPAARAALVGLVAGLALLGVGLLLAGAIARGILRPIARLQRLAAQPDITAPPPPTGLEETDAVARALYTAARTRHEAEAELHALTETLERRVAEAVREREQARARAAQAERMQALGRLAGGIAHDFNNVLQIVDSAVALLNRHAGEAEGTARMTRLLGDAVRRGRAITGRLLAFARPGVPSPEPVALGPLLEGLRELFLTTLGPAIRVELAVAPDLPTVRCERGQLETVLVNLATNARDAMRAGGRLRLLAGARELGEGGGEGAPPGLAPGRYVCISVADTGAGMDAATLARVQEPFFTTKPPGEGTGLGLALARGFCEQSGGALAIESAPGAGTTVTLWLPAAG